MSRYDFPRLPNPLSPQEVVLVDGDAMYLSCCPFESAPIAVLANLQDVGVAVSESLMYWPQVPGSHFFIKGISASTGIDELISDLLRVDALPKRDGVLEIVEPASPALAELLAGGVVEEREGECGASGYAITTIGLQKVIQNREMQGTRQIKNKTNTHNTTQHKQHDTHKHQVILKSK
jgi:hypothetical protein